MVYLAGSLALAVVETRVHPEVHAASEPYVAIELSLPEGLVAEAGPLEEGWQRDLAQTRALGSEWLASGEPAGELDGKQSRATSRASGTPPRGPTN